MSLTYKKGSPFTFISKDSIDALTNSKPEEFDDKISIHGYDTLVLESPENSNFSKANVLGCDYLSDIKALIALYILQTTNKLF